MCVRGKEIPTDTAHWAKLGLFTSRLETIDQILPTRTQSNPSRLSIIGIGLGTGLAVSILRTLSVVPSLIGSGLLITSISEGTAQLCIGAGTASHQSWSYETERAQHESPSQNPRPGGSVSVLLFLQPDQLDLTFYREITRSTPAGSV